MKPRIFAASIFVVSLILLLAVSAGRRANSGRCVTTA